MAAEPRVKQTRKAKGICITGIRKEIRMTEPKTSGKAGRPSRSPDEEIAAVAARLQALRDKKEGRGTPRT